MGFISRNDSFSYLASLVVSPILGKGVLKVTSEELKNIREDFKNVYNYIDSLDIREELKDSLIDKVSDIEVYIVQEVYK